MITYTCSTAELFPDGSTGEVYVTYECDDERDFWQTVDGHLRGAGADSAWPIKAEFPDGTVMQRDEIVATHWREHFGGYMLGATR